MADNGASRKSVDRRKPCDCSYGGCQIEALFVRRKFVPSGRVTCLPNLPLGEQFFVLFLMTKLGGPFTCMRNKKLARLKWYPSNWTKLFRW